MSSIKIKKPVRASYAFRNSERETLYVVQRYDEKDYVGLYVNKETREGEVVYRVLNSAVGVESYKAEVSS